MPDSAGLSTEVNGKRGSQSGLWFRYGGLALPTGALLLGLALASFPYPLPMRVAGKVTTRSVDLTLQQPPPERISIGVPVTQDAASARPYLNVWPASTIELPAGFDNAELSNVAGATLTADRLMLSTIRFAAGLNLTLTKRSGKEIIIRVQGAKFSLELSATGLLSVLPDAGAELHRTLDAPEIVKVGLPGSTVLPTVVRANIGNDFELGNLEVSRLGFTKPVSSGGFDSDIVSGTVHLVDIARTESVDAGAALLLDGFEGWVVGLQSTKEGFALSFTGSVRRLRSGPLGHTVDLRPSTLEYLFHQQWLSMMWISAAAGLAVIARVRSWLVGKLEG